MPRSKATFHYQPDENTCGPASLKTAFEIIGRKRTLKSLVQACKTTRNGTSVKNLISAINKSGLPVLAIEWATLRHLQSALKPIVGKPRAIIVNYQEEGAEEDENGHYATVASYSSRTSRIFLFDTLDGGKKSYKWTNFIDLWWDFDYRRVHLPAGRQVQKPEKQFKLARKYYNRLMLIIAKKPEHLPNFKIPTAKLFSPSGG